MGSGQGHGGAQLEGLAAGGAVVQASNRRQGLIWTSKQLRVPWLLVCSSMAAHSPPEHAHSMEDGTRHPATAI